MADGHIFADSHDPAWAKRVAKMEKEFRRAERRSSKAPRPPRQPRQPRRRFWAAMASILAVIVVAAFSYRAVYRHANAESLVPIMNSPAPIETASIGSTDPAGRVAPTPDAQSTARATATPGVPVGGTAMRGDPFAQSPAARWPTAAVGVVMPPAKPIGQLSRTQVQAALTLAHKFIETARSDPAVLARRDLTGLESMVVKRELAAAHFDDGGSQSILLPSRLAPGFVLAAPIRVNGSVTVTYVPRGPLGSKYLAIEANLVWAYALTPHSDSIEPNSTLVLLHDRLRLGSAPSDAGQRLIVEGESYAAYNIDCGYLAQGWLGLPRTDDPSRQLIPTGAPLTGTQAYDPRTDLNAGRHSCK